MDKLWAPWRIKYVKTVRKPKGCIFCRAANSRKNYVIFKTKWSLSMLNAFPYNNGHIMIAPLAHKPKISQLTEGEILDLFRALDKSRKLLDKVLKPHGYNIGINLSETAGAGIPGHLHLHIVPRWKGDTNFMPVIYNAKIISQSLDELYRQIKNAGSKTD